MVLCSFIVVYLSIARKNAVNLVNVNKQWQEHCCRGFPGYILPVHRPGIFGTTTTDQVEQKT